MKIVFQGASVLSGSYGRVNVHLALALSRLGHSVYIEPWDQSTDACSRAIAGLGIPLEHNFAVAACPINNVDVTVRQCWPPVWAPPRDGSKLVVIQPWEYGSLPLAWLPGVDSADAIWVPSNAVKAGYIQSGVAPEKVWVIPNGTDFLQAPAAASRPRSQELLSLLFLGGGIHRKGPDVLISALDALDDEALSRIRLTIKETGTDSYYRDQSIVERALAEAPRVGARTTVIRSELTRADLAGLMTRHDALVHPYRAEGFALPVLEAMSCGLPVIVPRGGATDDFCKPGEALFIDSQLQQWSTPFVGDLLTVDFPYHREPSVAQLQSILISLARREIDLEQLRVAAHARGASLSWVHAASQAHAAIEDLLAGRSRHDAFSQASDAVRRSIGEPMTCAWIDAVGRLLGLGDWKSALRLLELCKRYQLDDQQLAHTLHRLQAVAASNADVWSAAPWRLEVAAALRDDSAIPNVVHRHEGSPDAVTDIAGAIAPYFASCRTVLDLGCGQGAMMRALRAQGKQVSGIEADPKLAACLRAEGFAVADGWIPRDLDAIGEMRVDGIFMGHIIEHLHPEQALEVMRWAADHLNDRGTLVVQTPDFAQEFVLRSNFWLDPTHVRPYPIALLTAMLETAGFSPLAGGCRSLAPQAPLDVLAVGRLRRCGVRTARAQLSSRSAQRLLHFGVFGSHSGMGRAARSLLDYERLASRNLETIRVDVTASSGAELPADTIPFTEALSVAGDLAIVDVPVGWLPEVLSRVRATTRVVRLAYEADPLPRYLVDALASADEVWVMSRFVERVAVAGGCDPARMVLVSPMVPLSVDANAEFAGSGGGNRPTIFSSVFNFEPRKNPESLLRAYAAVRSIGHDVKLTLKASGISDEQFWVWASAVLGSATAAEIRPGVQLYTSHLESEQLRSMLARSDAFVLPTRGEGFGLPFLEAMAAGVPVICPDEGGHRDFCDEETSFLVPTTRVPCAIAWNIPVFRESRWHEVVFDELISAMERIVTSPEQVREKARASLNRARDHSRVDQSIVAERRVWELLERQGQGRRVNSMVVAQEGVACGADPGSLAMELGAEPCQV